MSNGRRAASELNLLLTNSTNRAASKRDSAPMRRLKLWSSILSVLVVGRRERLRALIAAVVAAEMQAHCRARRRRVSTFVVKRMPLQGRLQLEKAWRERWVVELAPAQLPPGLISEIAPEVQLRPRRPANGHARPEGSAFLRESTSPRVALPPAEALRMRRTSREGVVIEAGVVSRWMRPTCDASERVFGGAVLTASSSTKGRCLFPCTASAC